MREITTPQQNAIDLAAFALQSGFSKWPAFTEQSGRSSVAYFFAELCCVGGRPGKTGGLNALTFPELVLSPLGGHRRKNHSEAFQKISSGPYFSSAIAYGNSTNSCPNCKRLRRFPF